MYISCCFPIAPFNILPLSLTFAVLITMYLWCSPLLFDPVWNSVLSGPGCLVSLPRLGKFQTVMSSDMLSVSLPSPPPRTHFWDPCMWMFVCWCCPRGFLDCPYSFYSFFFSTLVISIIDFSSLVYSFASSNLMLFPSNVFISFMVFFISVWLLFIFSNSFKSHCVYSLFSQVLWASLRSLPCTLYRVDSLSPLSSSSWVLNCSLSFCLLLCSVTSDSLWPHGL